MIKIFECKFCEYKGTRKEVRKHIRKNHLWQGKKSLQASVKSYEAKKTLAEFEKVGEENFGSKGL